jgi:hypothetical protein
MIVVGDREERHQKKLNLMTRKTPQHALARQPVLQGGVEGNARLTSAVAVVIFVLLALEGLTIVRIGSLLSPHVFIGVLLIPPVLVKISSTTWRFYKYYAGDPEYRQKGPPQVLLRLLGPFVVVLTVVVFASGVGLVFLPLRYSSQLLLIHKASFVLWFAATAVHVLGHVAETAQLAPRDWLARSRRQVRGASPRQWLLVSSLVLGLVVALVLTPYAYGWWTRA